MNQLRRKTLVLLGGRHLSEGGEHELCHPVYILEKTSMTKTDIDLLASFGFDSRAQPDTFTLTMINQEQNVYSGMKE
jgi:hypothetical protein